MPEVDVKMLHELAVETRKLLPKPKDQSSEAEQEKSDEPKQEEG